MKFIRYLSLFFLLTSTSPLNAQELTLYDLMLYENADESFGFISLSDIYNPELLDNPDFNNEFEKDKVQRENFKLNSKDRKQFLSKTKILETDKVFIYSYSKNILVSFPVNCLNVTAVISPYAEVKPYSIMDYRIGFQIDNKYLKGFEEYFRNTLVYIGKESPFILNQMQPIAWKKIEKEKLPIIANDTIRNTDFKHYNNANYFTRVESYSYETNNLHYYIQNILLNKENRVVARYLFILNKKSGDIVFSHVYADHESASLAALNFVESSQIEQWTGRLFKNMPPVLFGFEAVKFGCARIDFINPTEKAIFSNCDNRH